MDQPTTALLLRVSTRTYVSLVNAHVSFETARRDARVRLLAATTDEERRRLEQGVRYPAGCLNQLVRSQETTYAGLLRKPVDVLFGPAVIHSAAIVRYSNHDPWKLHLWTQWDDQTDALQRCETITYQA